MNCSTFCEIAGETMSFEGLYLPLAAEDDTFEGTKGISPECALKRESPRGEGAPRDVFIALGSKTFPDPGCFGALAESSILESEEGSFRPSPINDCVGD